MTGREAVNRLKVSGINVDARPLPGPIDGSSACPDLLNTNAELEESRPQDRQSPRLS
ncbi:MAG: hypothetical protein R3B67_03745 [Phycisphaerales bacterium]